VYSIVIVTLRPLPSFPFPSPFLFPLISPFFFQETGEPLYQRPDDNEATLTRRLTTYHTLTAPLKAYYANHGKLVNIYAAVHPKHVSDQINSVEEHFAKK